MTSVKTRKEPTSFQFNIDLLTTSKILPNVHSYVLPLLRKLRASASHNLDPFRFKLNIQLLRDKYILISTSNGNNKTTPIWRKIHGTDTEYFSTRSSEPQYKGDQIPMLCKFVMPNMRSFQRRCASKILL